MKKQNKKTEIINMFANTLTYQTQDLLGDISEGGRFNFKQYEKEVKKCLLEFVEAIKKEE